MNNPPIKQQLKDIFPVQHKLVQTKIDPCFYFTLVQNYVRNINVSKHIFDQSGLEAILLSKNVIAQHSFVFYKQYGSILVKSDSDKKFVPPNIGVLFFKQLSMNIFTCQDRIVEYLQDTRQVGYYQIETVPYNFTIDMEKLKGHILQFEKKLTKQQASEKTPFAFKSLVENSVQQMRKSLLFGSEKTSLGLNMSKQGTRNFNNHNFPEVNIQLCFLIYSFVLGNQKLARLLLLGFKMNYLYNQICRKDVKQQTNIVKECLNQLILKYKYIYNQEISHKKDVASQIFQFINKTIQKEHHATKFELLATVSSLNQSLKLQRNFQQPQPMKKVTQYSCFSPSNIPNANHIGFTMSLIFDEFYPFSQLKTLYDKLTSQQNGQFYWIKLVQKCFFELSFKITNLSIHINQVLISARQQVSIMHSVVNLYESIMITSNKNSQYSFRIKNQAYSHVYLIKYLAAVIAFQIQKKNQQNLFNINNYTIELKIETVYSNFTSLDFLARKAIQNVANYIHSNKHKPTIFSLSNNSNRNSQLKKMAKYSLQKYADERLYLENIRKRIEEDKKKLQQQMNDFRVRYKAQTQVVLGWSATPCQCRTEEIQNKYTKIIQKKFIQCNRCIRLREQERNLYWIKNQTFQQIKANLPKEEEEQNLFAFFNKIKQITGGIMKVIYQSQIPIMSKCHFSQRYSNYMSPIGNLNPYSKQIYVSTHKYLSYLDTFKAQNFVIYHIPIVIYYYNYSSPAQIELQLLKPEAISSYNSLQWMINRSDSSNNNRQHMVYANLDKKQSSKIKQLASLNLQQFKQYASIRVCFRVQLIMLAQGILSRQIAPSTIKLHEFQRLIVMNACGNISSFRAYQNSILAPQQLIIVRESIQQLLQKYLDQWKFNDLYSLQIIGVILNLLSKIINLSHLVPKIAQRAFQQYEIMRAEKGIKSLNIKLRELFILHSIMSCFSEDICRDSSEACIVFAKIMVNYRLNKRFITQQSQKNNIYASHVKFYINYFNQAVIKNIHSVVRYFASHPQYLTDIVKEIDQDITKKCVWRFIAEENYVFQGSLLLNSYKINLFEGIILKNGAQSSKLPLKIKEDSFYRTIFGLTTDLQVFQLRNGAIRTRSDFHSYFQQQKGSEIFFEFCTTKENQVKIKMIIKKQNSQESYLLLPHSILESQNIYIPELYLKNYQCWIDQRRRHLIFRKKSLGEMNKIGLIMMQRVKVVSLGLTNIIQAEYGRIITKQFQNQPLDYLIQQKHSDFFQQLIITDKMHFNNKAIEVLSSIQDPRYILQTYSNGKKKKIIFWLHRCDLKFTFDEKLGLVSQNFQGYSVPNDYRHNQFLPWRRSDYIRCLVLKKYEHTFQSAILHEYMLLLPSQAIGKNGMTIIAEGSIPNSIFSYQIHDNFMDIRSKSRLNQIHLVCLIASLNSGLFFKPLMITNEQYCISLIRSCYSNNQLGWLESIKVVNLINLCVEMNLTTLLLCCMVLTNLTGSLRDILAYKQKTYSYQSLLNPALNNKEALLRACKLIYRKKVEEKLISPHGKLNSMQLILLGISEKILQQTRREQKLTKWAKQFYSPQLQQKVITGLQEISQSYHKSQKDIEHLKQTILNFFQKQQQKQDSPEKEYNLHIKLHDNLATEMLKDMDDSYKSYLRYSQKYQQIQLTKEQSKKNLIKFFLQPKQKCQKIKRDLGKYLQKIHSKANQHLDIIVGYKTVLKANSYTQILCNPQLIFQYYPNISKEHSEVILTAIREWILLTLQIQSLSRILLILGDKTIDKVALFRELESPRKEINIKDYWICFEAEMKIRIWQSQYDTFKHLRESQSGAVSQLNMGEGKTQVIIPMIVLDNIYDKNRGNPISRINILSQLFQEAQGNYFRFFSVTSFRIPIFSLYFNREVKLQKQSIDRIKFVIYLLRKKMLMLLDRESCLSMILKIREDTLKKGSYIQYIGSTRDDWLYDGDDVFDIFDQVDALMTCKKSFVYSIGESSDLADARLRFQFARIFLQIVCVEMFQWLLNQKMAVIQETYEKALQSIKKGGFPKGFRLKKNLNSKQLAQFRHKIIDIFLNDINYRPPQFQFYQHISQKCKKILLIFLTDESNDSIGSLSSEVPTDINPILAVRGYIAFHILQHCLTMRNGVDYGVPGQGHPKSVGVPYEAADVPSKRSQFSHPDVAIIVSYLSYFAKGISSQQFNDSLYFLLDRPQSAKYYNYSLWTKIIEDEKHKPKDVMQARQINIDSQTQVQYLYEKYKFNRNTIVFWLINKVFQKDLRQYAKSITSSCWDISYVDRSIGFSGTKDTRWLFPNYLQWSPSHNDTINGTDGKMVHQMLRSTKGILVIKEGKESLWERFCQNVLDLTDQQIGCIIDAGAILVGKSFEKEIVPWIVKNPRFNKQKFKGITFCDENGKWQVFDTVTLSVVERGTSIPQHDTFVIFDEARTRGADIKMGTNVRAVVSLSPTMTKDKLMQAVGRLRKFGRNQQIYIMGTNQVFQKIEVTKEGISLKKKVQMVIEWACENSIGENRNMQYANSKLAQIHYKTILDSQPEVQLFDSSLKSLYSGTITQKSVYQIYQTSISSKFSQQHKKTQMIKKLSQKMKVYGYQHTMKAYDFQGVCERQVETIQEVQAIIEDKYDPLIALEQNNTVQIHNQKISNFDFKFNSKLKFSKNFINCTRSNRNIQAINNYNELCNINFFLWWNNQLIIITQRQMTLQLYNGTDSQGYFSLQQTDDEKKRFVGRFKDLSKYTPFIITNSLGEAITHAQFFNGIEFYDNQARQILANLIKIYLKNSKNTKQPSTVSQSTSTNSLFGNSFQGNLPSNAFNQSNKSNGVFGKPLNTTNQPNKPNGKPFTAFNQPKKSNEGGVFGNSIYSNNILSFASNSPPSPVVVQKQKSDNDILDIQQVVSHFLLRRRTFHSKYINSDLQKVMIQLKSVSSQKLE